MVYKKNHIPWNKGKQLSEEHKGKISISKKKYFQSHGHPTKGRKLTQEHKDAISKANTGRKLTKEQIERSSASRKAFYKQKRFERKSQGHKKYYETHTVWNNGLKHKESTKRKISESMINWWKERKDHQ